MWIYDRDGQAALLLSASGRLFTPHAIQVGWLEGSAVFTRQAQHVAWFSGGLLRDVHGCVAGFSPGAADPVRPTLPSSSAPSAVLSLPVSIARPACAEPVERLTDQPVWSALRPLELFPHST
jgi:hypothetical protein